MPFPAHDPLPPPRFRGSTAQSFYLPMRDGVRLAVDLYLPRGLTPGDRVPTLLAATRYWRAQQFRRPWRWFLAPPDSARRFFTAYGYAVARIDLRGTGASEGHQPHPWPASDLTDLYDLVDWVIQQPWSSGQVGGFGNSYQATVAELLGACGHPAVTGALVRFNEFDVYTDIAFPGGVPNAFMLREWADFNRALDANQVPAQWPWLERWLVQGVKPVNGAPIPVHHNQQVDSALRQITFRDDVGADLGVAIDAISVHTRPTTHFLDHWGGWFDAATADAVLRRFVHTRRPQRAVIGPWNHGATQHLGDPAQAMPLLAQMQEALRVWEQPPATRTLHYYTLFADTWTTVDEWPPAGVTETRYFFHPDGQLAPEVLPPQPAHRFTVDFSATTGTHNRWQTELDQRPVRYAPIQASVAYTTAPLTTAVELTGYPVVTLWLRSTHTDGSFFVYLEALDEQGGAHYLTEGLLRALHRRVAGEPPPYAVSVPYHSYKRQDAWPLVPGEAAELTFGLNPISALLRPGWCLKLSVTGADHGTFARLPADGTPIIDVLLGGDTASRIDLPLRIPAAASLVG